MRKIFFAAAILISFYIAGINQSLTLMIICFSEIFISAAMLLSVIFIKITTKITPYENFLSVNRNNTLKCRFKVKSILPLGRMVIELRADGKTQKIKCICHENIIDFRVNCEHCGIFTVDAASIKFFDYIGLFSVKKKLNQSIKVCVFPKSTTVSFELSPDNLSDGFECEELLGQKDNTPDVRGLKEYSGTSLKNIHWKQSAKTDKLWEKEYEKDKSVVFEICLLENPYPDDKYYDAVYSCIDKLLNLGSVRVYFGRKSMDIYNAAGIRELFIVLYAEKEIETSVIDTFNMIVIDSDGEITSELNRGRNVWK